MKKIAILAFSLTGLSSGSRIKNYLIEEGVEVTLDVKSRYVSEATALSLHQWTEAHFFTCDALIFVGSCGIAVRAIAPFVVSKKSDPAVLVIDECGQHAISLLSGHLGGANALTAELSRALDFHPVITTATDLHQKFAIDVFAKEQGCAILNMKAAKEISAAILAGEPVGFYSEFPIEGTLPEGVYPCDIYGKRKADGTALRVGAAVTIHTNIVPFSETCLLIPACLALGLGCRKGKEGEVIFQKIQEMLKERQLFPQAIKIAASIDLKAEEAGILSALRQLGIPYETYSGDSLKAVEGDFTPSAFVSSITGVDNVCERSAVLAIQNQEIRRAENETTANQAITKSTITLLQRKKAADGVTLALAAEDWRICFE